jgi:hypothetical protein
MKKIYLLIVALLLTVGYASAERYYVNDAVPSSGNGSTWGVAFKTIPEAVSAATTAGDEIWIAGGTYNINATLNVINGIKIVGGFAGTESAISERVQGINP